MKLVRFLMKLNNETLTIELKNRIIVLGNTEGLQSGCNALRRPTRPETWGQAIDVPYRRLNGTWRLS
ncbi:Sm-like ribonucleoproteins protein [Dioscorea alata]|uniref:Sm-like ribonucleoproteins protein n=2 Tax=Dioscorea alata TaxID=55571 RepID=A0ACB7W9S6_DIOAL|nr:Sm-like ribonucleoproteins protein [Dioscorea alata]KAH7684218.1 Sm-like ribonucleoproteins protein [Dioscorea alata]